MLSIRCFPTVPFWILTFFIVGAIFPWRDALGDSYYDHQRLLQSLMLMVLATVWVARNRRQDLLAACRDRYLILGFWAMMAGGAASVWFGLVPANGLINYVHWLLLFSLFVVCTQARASDASFTAGGMLAAQAVAVFLGILYLVFALFGEDLFNPNIIYPGVDNIRFFNQIQVFVGALLVFLLGRPRIGGWAFALLTANILLMILGGARGTIFVALMIMFLVGLVLPQQRPRVYRAVAALLAAGVVYVGLHSLEFQGTYPMGRSESSERLDMWMKILDFLKFHNILWGVGPGNYDQFEIIYSHPHNSILQFLIEWGATALTGAALIIGRLLVLAYRHVRRYPEDELTQALLAALVAGLGYSLVSGVIVMPVPQTLLFMFAGLVWGRVALAEKRAASSPTGLEGRQRIESSNSICSWQSLLAALLILVLTVPYVWLVSNYYLQATSTSGLHGGPGFWRNGAAFVLPAQ
jgi:O-antigen ligase